MTIDKLLRRPEVQARVRLSTSRIYGLMATGDFPRPIKIATRSVAWKESEIDAWIRSRPLGGPDPRYAQATDTAT